MGQGYFRSVRVPLNQVEISYHILRDKLSFFVNSLKNEEYVTEVKNLKKIAQIKKKTLKTNISDIVCKEKS